jgi:N-acetylglucosaminyl-diphospho-decaprenol L-rhamnosyltransferase
MSGSEQNENLPAIAVVVVTWNSARQLGGLIESLPSGMAGVRFQLIIADNASADDTVSLARRLAPDCTILQTGRNAGYAAAFNAGVAAAGPYDAALILNPDIRLSSGCVAMLYAQLGDDVGIAVPRIRNEDGTLARSLRREPTIARALGEAVLGQRSGRFPALGETVVDDAAYAEPGIADWATGAVMLISARCLATCGPWDESFFLYSEETDFALRARDAGFRTRYLPGAEVTHLGGESAVSPRLWSLLQVNRVRLYRRRHTAAATMVYWSAVMLRESSRALLGHPRARAAAAALVRPSTVSSFGTEDGQVAADAGVG